MTKDWVYVPCLVAIWANTFETGGGGKGLGWWLINNTVQEIQLHLSATLYMWTVLYITTVVWLLSSEYKYFIHFHDILYRAGIPPGWNTHQLNLVPLLAVLPSSQGKSSANFKKEKKQQQHMEWFLFRLSHTFIQSYMSARRTHISHPLPKSIHLLQNKKINRTVSLQRASRGWFSGFVQYVYLHYIYYKEFLQH